MADNASSLRNGNKVLIENQPYLILDTDFVNPGKGQAFTRIKIRNLLNNKVLEKAVLMQASALAISGKVYTPFYRQAHIRSYRMYNNGGKEALELAYQDVKKSFEVYLKKYNKGRPIIILSHSQGSSHTSRLLTDFFDGKELQKQLVAAYIPGMRIQPDQFNSIQPMTKPGQIGGFVSWNTFKKGHYPKKDKNLSKFAEMQFVYIMHLQHNVFMKI